MTKFLGIIQFSHSHTKHNLNYSIIFYQVDTNSIIVKMLIVTIIIIIFQIINIGRNQIVYCTFALVKLISYKIWYKKIISDPSPKFLKFSLGTLVNQQKTTAHPGSHVHP